ncbi:hypothetical protein BAOM_3022 [Peribacillus asahii]|uniref:Uncharacterized protein n=1 Tax=Peribacillus asahii TaxID=228899 RepID=A0A3Q9RNK6_9BACI|nr:hypothetical protein [Peribacillus asahii]AZV43631.1 hypothetical protein BAOM_3022 [Peribacillus asahii]
MNKDQLEILTEILINIGDKLQYLQKEYDDYTIHNMAEWLKYPDISEGVIVKHKFKDYGEGYVRNINMESTHPLEVHFSFYPEYVDCNFSDLEVIK